MNQFPSLKTKILGPKLEQPECDVTAVTENVTAPRSPFSPSLAAAAVAATGIAASKRKFTEDVFQPDPARLARELQRERRRRGRAINRNGSGNVINPAAYVTGSSPPFSRIRRRSPGDNSNSKLRRIAAKSVLGPFRTSERRGGVERRQKRS